MRSSTSNLLTIAGFDPSSGAGITADLSVMAAHGFFGTSCITALTAQSTRGVRSVEPVRAEFLAESLACVAEDLPPAGVKIGMLGSAEAVAVVCDFLAGLPERVPVVLDPVIRSSSGRALLSPDGLTLLCRRLLPMLGWVTPNLAELAALTGQEVTDAAGMERAGAALCREFPELHVVVTGGHLARPDDLLLAPGADPVWLSGEPVETRATHGTGCAFSSALLCRLLTHEPPMDAVRGAKNYVAEAMRRAVPRGHGAGPLELLWPLREV